MLSRSKKKHPHPAFGLTIIAAVVAITFAVLWAERNNESNPAEELAAYSAAKNFVREQLPTPASADFPLIPPDSAALGGGRYRFGGHVDFQNEFGAAIRRKWVAVVRRRAGSERVEFDLESVEIGEK